MKKVFAVIAIISLVACAAFADETHKIHIRADVTEVVPAFQLEYKTVKTNTPAQGDPAVYGTNPSYTPNTADSAAVNTGFKLDVGGDVEVTVYLANAAKQKQSYKLTFSDGIFDVTRNAVAGKKAPTIAVAATTESVKGTSTITASGAVLTANFNGTKADENQVLGTATYTYTADDKIDPGTYYADIVLTIAVAN